MYSDEMNKIEVRNVEKYPLFTVFYEVFFSTGNHNIFICCPNRIKIRHHLCKIQNKIKFYSWKFFSFLCSFIFFEILRVNYLCELGTIYAYKLKTMKKTEKLHRRK